MPSNHHHTLLYLPDCAEAETFLKQTILQVLSTTNNANVKLMTVSYPENFLKVETNNKSAASAISVRGEKMKSLMNQKTTEGLSCKIKIVWEYEKHNLLGASVGSEKALFVFQRLLELESSDAPFKDSILSYIDLLQKGFGRFYVTEHSRTLDIDLGVTNAQCTCFECMTQPLQIIGSARRLKKATTTLRSFFLFMMKTQLMIHHFCKHFVLRQTLLLFQTCLLKCFLRRTFAKTL